MTTSLKLKLIGLATTIVLFVLPVADALAGRNWGLLTGARPSTTPRRPAMTTSLKLKLISLATTIALLALPAADALAGRSWS